MNIFQNVAPGHPPREVFFVVVVLFCFTDILCHGCGSRWGSTLTIGLEVKSWSLVVTKSAWPLEIQQVCIAPPVYLPATWVSAVMGEGVQDHRGWHDTVLREMIQSTSSFDEWANGTVGGCCLWVCITVSPSFCEVWVVISHPELLGLSNAT